MVAVRRGGFVIRRTDAQYSRPFRLYRGLDGCLSWPVDLGAGDIHDFGWREGLGGGHSLATNPGQAADYIELCIASGYPVEVLFVDNGQEGVLWQEEHPHFELIGYEVAALGDFYSAIWEELIVECRHEPGWLERLNHAGLFPTVEEARLFLDMRNQVAPLSNGFIEDLPTLCVASLWRVQTLEQLQRYEGPDEEYLRYVDGVRP